MRSYEQSQMRLGMNRIDLLLIHDLDFWFHATEAKVVGLSSASSSPQVGGRLISCARTVLCAAWAGNQRTGNDAAVPRCVPLDFFLVALRYTLMEQDVLNVSFPARARRDRVVVGGVFNSGITATGPIPAAQYNYSDATPEQMDRVAK